MDWAKLTREMGTVAKRELLADGLRVVVAQLMQAGRTEPEIRALLDDAIAKAKQQPPPAPVAT